MSQTQHTRQSGYVALLSTLIIGAISLSIASAVLLIGIGNQQSTIVAQWSAQARNGVSGCAEEALLQIQANTSFTGTGSQTIGEASCTYTVTNTGTSTRTISANATVGGVVKKVLVYVTIASASISITSWQEVS